MSLRIVIDRGRYEGIDEIREKLGDSGNVRQSVTPVLQEARRIGAAEARLLAPKGATGNLEEAIDDRAITYRVRGDYVYTVFGVNPVPNAGRGKRLYPLYVHEGTGLFGHLKRMITPRRKPAMVFPGGGKPWPITVGRTGVVITKNVRGQKPQPYMRLGFEVADNYVSRHIDDMIDNILD
jgi:hypothetical protein